MSHRHSYLSTTGLVRPGSSLSMASVASTSEDTASTPETLPASRASSRPVPTPRPAAKTYKPLTTKAGIIPLGPGFFVWISAILSLLFISCLSFAFIPDDDQRPAFGAELDDVAANSPGIVLIGDDVDVDIDEPALTIRWSIIACGDAYMLAGSAGTHGSNNCGLPAMPLHIFVDGNPEPAASYDPTTLPWTSNGRRNSIQNLFQFDDDHVLDVHNARLYPFDTYLLTSTIRVVSATDNTSLPLQKMATITLTSSFVTISDDSASTTKIDNTIDEASRDLSLDVSRPPEARMFALLLFAANWMLAHASLGMVVLSSKSNDCEKYTRHLVAVLVIMLAVPQLRNSMPDAPGFDGEKLYELTLRADAIGFFPQMLLCAGSGIAIICLMAKRELQEMEGADEERTEEEPRKEGPAPLSTGLMKMRRGGASIDMGHIRNFSRKLSVSFGRG
ncbi:uncharacterized protein BXZ73DRAFT_51259 [Epithele typhae]|uniref:uncharacterized protein n=1 Tax=Epithele typhae TaxID=378194 RepID=UPI0020089690|nr:uncharacterized protein BXZ73DRAFT_51259 [Epithele typhae]KAH9922859.1 hypothetical protein BXZ73DRAFT_51259 [Epithele typhae]